MVGVCPPKDMMEALELSGLRCPMDLGISWLRVLYLGGVSKRRQLFLDLFLSSTRASQKIASSSRAEKPLKLR